jgi:hypothetical protein
MLTKLCTWTAKTRAVPSLHHDSIMAKVPGPYLVLRQVTPTNFIAGPLAQIRAVGNSSIIALNNIFGEKKQL